MGPDLFHSPPIWKGACIVSRKHGSRRQGIHAPSGYEPCLSVHLLCSTVTPIKPCVSLPARLNQVQGPGGTEAEAADAGAHRSQEQSRHVWSCFTVWIARCDASHSRESSQAQGHVCDWCLRCCFTQTGGKQIQFSFVATVLYCIQKPMTRKRSHPLTCRCPLLWHTSSFLGSTQCH